MSDVIDITDRLPYHRGLAKCLQCKHEWQAVVPVVGGTSGFECPSCGFYKGVFAGLFDPPSDTPIWTCPCGCDTFKITPDIILCVLCGKKEPKP